MNIQVGQTIYLKPVGNAARGGYRQITEATVTKIGKKYFEVEPKYFRKFYIENGRQASDFASYVAYESKEEIEQENELQRLTDEVLAAFRNTYRLALTADQCRRILAIINEPK